jgi:hypothetical protein
MASWRSFLREGRMLRLERGGWRIHAAARPPWMDMMGCRLAGSIRARDPQNE